MDLHDPSGHLRDDIDGDSGNDLTVAADHHRHIDDLRPHDLDQRAEGGPLDPGRRLAGGHEPRGQSDAGDEDDQGKQTFEGFVRHQETSFEL